jgi:hypothetical protein
MKRRSKNPRIAQRMICERHMLVQEEQAEVEIKISHASKDIT